MEKTNTYKWLFWATLLCTIVIAVVFITVAVENERQRREISRQAAELDEAEIIEEGEIVSIDNLEEGGTIHVLYSDGSGKPVAVIEVDVFYELIHTSIEVGDTAVYVRGRHWEDADLLTVIKREPDVGTKKATIIEYALADIDETGNATLYFVSIETFPHLDWDCATYIMTVNGKMYVVGVQERGDEVHFVDVTDELYTV